MNHRLHKLKFLIAGLAVTCVVLSFPGVPVAPAFASLSMLPIHASIADPADTLVVTGASFTPNHLADVYVYLSTTSGTSLLEHDVVTVSAQGTFTDNTSAVCQSRPFVIDAFDRASMKWSNILIVFCGST